MCTKSYSFTKGRKEDLLEMNDEILDLNLDELETVNGGGALADAILNSESIASFIRNNKTAGIALEVCINRACDYLRAYMDKYITRDQIIAIVTRIYEVRDAL